MKPQTEALKRIYTRQMCSDLRDFDYAISEVRKVEELHGWTPALYKRFYSLLNGRKKLIETPKKNISLSNEQIKKLRKLWFVYGNNGEKSTLRNHKFIQGILETGKDDRVFYRNTPQTERGRFGGLLTDECLIEVDKIIK